MPHDDTPSSIPFGYCHCGCGQKTTLAKWTRKARGHVKGEPLPFCDGHYVRTHPDKNRRAVRSVGDGIAAVSISSRKYPGLHALVDEIDVELVGQHLWTLNRRHGNVYAEARIRDEQGQMRRVFMHRLILGFGPGDPEVDHANGNGLDNRRQNIRPCTRSQNQANRKRLPAESSSQYRGVIWLKREKVWRAHIKRKFIGTFKCEVEAAKAYDRAALEHYGEFANLNFPHVDLGEME